MCLYVCIITFFDGKLQTSIDSGAALLVNRRGETKMKVAQERIKIKILKGEREREREREKSKIHSSVSSVKLLSESLDSLQTMVIWRSARFFEKSSF